MYNLYCVGDSEAIPGQKRCRASPTPTIAPQIMSRKLNRTVSNYVKLIALPVARHHNLMERRRAVSQLNKIYGS